MSHVDVMKYAPKPFIVIVIMLVSLFFLFCYSNSLFYTISLLLFCSFILFVLVCSNYISSFIFLLLIIVYCGAIIILIGYVCAVCPNLSFIPNMSYSFYSLFFIILIPTIFSISLPTIFSTSLTHFTFFYTSYGSMLFLLLVLILFITLLLVTSQYLSPKGPFRSTNF